MNAPASPLAIVDVETLREIIREELRAIASPVAPPKSDDLMSPTETCKLLGVSGRTLHRLRGQGLPCIYVGDSPRYLRSEVLGYLRGVR